MSKRICGTIHAPASKSMAQRAVLIAGEARGESEIVVGVLSEDIEAAVRIVRGFGAEVQRSGEVLLVRGTRERLKGGQTIDCGESGFTLRAAAALAALRDVPIVLAGNPGLLRRPVSMVKNPLCALGAEVQLCGDCPPISVCGPIRGGKIELDGSVSSQFVSGLLMALPRVHDDSEITVHQLKSKPYVTMTMAVMAEFGITVEASDNLSQFQIRGGQAYRPSRYTVEGDWSAAAFLLVAGAIAGEVTVTNLRANSAQPDRAVVKALEDAGATVNIGKDGVTVKRGLLRSFQFDATDCPDLFPALVVLAAAAEGVSEIQGVRRLKHKESDRGQVLRTEYGKLGIEITVSDDLMLIRGGEIRGGEVKTHEDHRIAMSLALAGLVSVGEVHINNPGCVAKSYPNFFKDLLQLQVKKENL